MSVLAALAVVMWLSCGAKAEGMPDMSAVSDALPAEARKISGTLTLDGSYDTAGAIERFVSGFKEAARDKLKGEIKPIMSVAGVGLICTAALAMCSGKGFEGHINTAACAAVTLLTVDGVDSLFEQIRSALDTASAYSHVALPAVFTASAVSGAALSSGARYAAVCLALDVMMSVTERLTVPLIYAFTALCVCKSIFKSPILTTCVSFVKWCAVTLMTFLTIGMSAYISLTSLLTSTADAAAIKAAKTVISTSLPVVGGIISDASGVVLTAASVIKASAGTFALVGVLAVCAAPFAAASVKLLVFKAASAVASAAENTGLSGLLSDLSTAAGMLLGLLGSGAILLFISFMTAVRTVSGV